MRHYGSVIRDEPLPGALTRAEIAETADVVARVLAAGAGEATAAALAIAARGPRWVSIVGRGTSDHAGLYARYLLERLLGIPVALAAPSLTTLYGGGTRWADALVISISQSGAGPDVVEVTEAARAGGATTIAVTNETGSRLAAAAEFVLDVRAGPEHSVAATKTYVGELAALAALGGRLVPGAGLGASLAAVPDAIHAVLAHPGEGIGAAADVVAAGRGTLVAARGIELATALELALKLKEMASLFADGYSGADLLHGPIVLAGPEVPAIVVRQAGAIGAVLDPVIERLAAAGSPVVRILAPDPSAPTAPAIAAAATPGAPRAGAVIDIRLPVAVDELVGPLLHIVPGQLLAVEVAVRRGREPDAPIGLTKVTQTR